MKTTRSIIAAVVLAAAALFSGCTKSPFPSPFSTTKPDWGHPEKNGTLHYRMQTLPQSPDNPFQWTYGRMNAVQLFFDGTIMTVPAVPLGRSGSIHTIVGLGVLTELGILHPPAGNYTALIFKERLSGADTGSAMVLTGTYNKSGEMIPVKFVIGSDALLQGELSSATIQLATAKEHVVSLFMDLDRLTASVDHGLIAQAFEDAHPDTEVLISAESNPQLYQAIFQSLLARDELKVSFE